MTLPVSKTGPPAGRSRPERTGNRSVDGRENGASFHVLKSEVAELMIVIGDTVTGSAITGDARVYGRVYVSTNGRGVIYGEPTDAKQYNGR